MTNKYIEKNELFLLVVGAVLIGIVLMPNLSLPDFGITGNVVGNKYSAAFVANNYNNSFESIIKNNLGTDFSESIEELNQDWAIIVKVNDFEKAKKYFKNNSDELKNLKELKEISAFSFKIKQKNIKNIISQKFVDRAYEDNIYYVMKDIGAAKLGAPVMWKTYLNGSYIDGENVNVAIIDTGIDYTHPSFGCDKIGDDCIISKGANFVNYSVKGVTRTTNVTTFINGDDTLELNLTSGVKKSFYIEIPYNSTIFTTEINVISSELSNLTFIIENKSIFGFNDSNIALTGFNLEIQEYVDTCENDEPCIIHFEIMSDIDENIVIHGLNINLNYTVDDPVSDPMDDHGHGTHVTGIMNAVAPKANIFAYKALNEYGGGYESDVVNAVLTAVRDGADVISMSLGFGLYDRLCNVGPLADAIRFAVENKVTIIAATGNLGSKTSVANPACIKETISVGAIDFENQIASFSNQGNLVDVVSYGVLINSFIPLSICYGCSSPGFTQYSGTSMAAPFVSGIAALYIQSYENTFNSKPLPENVKQIMLGTADDLGVLGKDSVYGYGIPNITKMILDLDSKSTISPVQNYIVFDKTGPLTNYTELLLLAQGKTKEFNLTVGWNSVVSGTNEIDLIVDGKTQNFSTTITDRLNIPITFSSENYIAGKYIGEIEINVLQTNRIIKIPVEIDIGIELMNGEYNLQGSLLPNEQDIYTVNIDGNATAITVEANWGNETVDIDVTMYSPNGDQLIITTEDLKKLSKKINSKKTNYLQNNSRKINSQKINSQKINSNKIKFNRAGDNRNE